jgi:hypothetical protein
MFFNVAQMNLLGQLFKLNTSLQNVVPPTTQLASNPECRESVYFVFFSSSLHFQHHYYLVRLFHPPFTGLVCWCKCIKKYHIKGEGFHLENIHQSTSEPIQHQYEGKNCFTELSCEQNFNSQM